jgi:hypothetical protein
MLKILDPKTAHDLIKRAVSALAGDEMAKKVSPSVEAAFELARQNVAAGGKHKTVITSVKVGVLGGSNGKPITTTVFDKREPVASGPNKRTPIRTGGGTCFTVTVGKVTVSICIEWED